MCNFADTNRNTRSMTALAQKVNETPMAPYIGLMRSMSQQQKLVVMAFLVDSMEEPTVDKGSGQMLKPNPFKNFKRASDFSDDERMRIIGKIKGSPVTPETDSLINGLSLTEEEMQDERTRYILGLDN